MDFSVAKSHDPKSEGKFVNRITNAKDKTVYSNCAEIKWFSNGFTTTPNDTFNGWSGLKKFDFGCIQVVDYGFLANTGLESVVIPASVYTLNNGVFKINLSSLCIRKLAVI